LAAEVLDLKSELSFDSLVFFSHDVSPDNVELVKDLRNASFRHLTIEGGLELFDLLNSFGWDPLVGVRHVLVLRFSLGHFGLNAEGVADVSNRLGG